MDQASQEVTTIGGKVAGISEGSNKVLELVTTMNQVSSDNSANFESIVSSTEEQLATTEELMALSETLNSFSGNLKKVISNFKV
jgi:methyl-accepting chemotaxis protein